MKPVGLLSGVIVKTPCKDTIPNLNAKKFDIIMSGMTIARQRNFRVDFREP